MKLLSYFTPKTPFTLVYMLQQFEYSASKFIKWVFSYPDLSHIQNRGKLDFTSRAKLLIAISYGAWFVSVLYFIFLTVNLSVLAILALFFIPDIIIICLLFASVLLQFVVVSPSQKSEISKATKKLALSNAIRIAVLGSYGKTTMKELLVTVLSEGKQIIATPGNKNVLISHAHWINRHIKGDEDVLVFEYGESQPGDIELLASFSKPDIAVISGIAPAHLDGYPNLDAIAQDFASITNFVKPENVYVNENKLLDSIKGVNYSLKGVGGWQAQNVSVTFEGTTFTLTNGTETLKLHTGLLGKHQIGPISVVVSMANKLGLSKAQIVLGVSKTIAFEHRMQPRKLGGAWIIDDTYNGNIEGMKAGLELLQDLPGKRKIYVTPGLVDQGEETEKVHLELGKLISKSKPDRVVLMQNSVTEFIQKGLANGGYQGEVALETNPLEYYTNLEHFSAAGDVIMLQNDWPDSYK